MLVHPSCDPLRLYTLIVGETISLVALWTICGGGGSLVRSSSRRYGQGREIGRRRTHHRDGKVLQCLSTCGHHASKLDGNNIVRQKHHKFKKSLVSAEARKLQGAINSPH